MTNETLEQPVPEQILEQIAEPVPEPQIAAELPTSSVAPLESVAPAAAATSSMASFFNSVRRLNLERTSDRWVGGVAAGIAHRLGWDPLIVRGIFIISFFFGGLGLIAYGVGWALLPEASDGRIHLQEALQGRFDPALIGAGLMVFSGMVSNGPLSWVTHRLSASNWPLFGWIGGLFSGIFWIVVAVLLIRWLRDQRYYRHYRKSNPVAAAPFPAPVMDNNVAALASDSDDVAELGLQTSVSENLESSIAETIVVDDVDATGGLVAAAVMADGVSATATKAEAKAAAKFAAEQRAAERAAVKDQAKASQLDERQQRDAQRAYQRQQREVERYQRALERSRKPITKGPGLVTVMLTLGALFLVWTAFQAINGGLIPTAVGAFGNPLLWVGITLLIIGAAIFISGIRGRKSGTLAGLSWLGLIATLPVVFLVPGIFGGPVAWGSGTTEWVRPAQTAQALGSGLVEPISLAQAERGFRGQFGSSTLDLTNLDLTQSTPANPAVIPIEFSAGDLTVLVPAGAAVEANVRLSGGEVGWQTWTASYEDFQHSSFNRQRVDYVDDDGAYTQVFTQLVNTPFRAPIFMASEAAREHGADLRLVIGAGAGSVIIREVAPLDALNPATTASSETN